MFSAHFKSKTPTTPYWTIIGPTLFTSLWTCPPYDVDWHLLLSSLRFLILCHHLKERMSCLQPSKHIHMKSSQTDFFVLWYFLHWKRLHYLPYINTNVYNNLNAVMHSSTSIYYNMMIWSFFSYDNSYKDKIR